MQMVKKLPLWFIVGLLTIFYFLFFCRLTLFTASDLGRHVTNGRVILETGKIFDTNLYSYTAQNRHAPNHHWLFGVIAYVLEKNSGFGSITLLTASLYAGAAGVIFWYIGTKYGKLSMLVSSIFILPLMTDRAEVRPEAFSIFFFALEVVLLLLWQEKRIRPLYLEIAFFLIACLWVNIHIFFFMTFISLGCFGLQALKEKNWLQVRELMIVGMLAIIGTLCNPLFIEGALYPTQILQEYGYPIAENQTPYFFLRYYTTNFHWYLVGTFIISIIAGLFLIRRNGFKHTALLLLFCIFLAFTNKLIRFSNFYSLLVALILASAVAPYRDTFSRFIKKASQDTLVLSGTSLVLFILVSLLFSSGMFLPFTPAMGLGLSPGINTSAEFFKQLTIQGPIFNNFDIGGYLIYHLYPKYQVYVDNRAEAYPAAFLEEYKATQTDPVVWQKIDAQYHFGAIYFSRLERTEWGQQFLVTTFKSKEWVPIYVDDYTVIFIRDIPEHAEIIKKYRLPDELFRVTE